MMTLWTGQIREAAKAAGLDPLLFEAQVFTESAGNPWASRPEPTYPYLWNVQTKQPFRHLSAAEASSKTAPDDFPMLAGHRNQEWLGQQTSWGLCQVMGAVARERGFMRPYLTELCNVDVNLQLGAVVLKDLKAWAHNDPRQMLAGFNGGKGGWNAAGPLAYADKVLALAKAWGG